MAIIRKTTAVISPDSPEVTRALVTPGQQSSAAFIASANAVTESATQKTTSSAVPKSVVIATMRNNTLTSTMDVESASVYNTDKEIYVTGLDNTVNNNYTYNSIVDMKPATNTEIGGIKVGSNLTITEDGTLSAVQTATYSLPIATTSMLGGVKVGNNLRVTSDGEINLPVATTEMLGGIKVGNNLSVTSDGLLSATQYELPVAASDVLGGVKIGSTLFVDGAGSLNVQKKEAFTTISGATGIVEHNLANGVVFYHTSIAANFTVNLTNIALDSGNALNVALVLSQGSVPYIPSALQIAGVNQTILWSGAATPAGTANRKEIVSLSVMNSGGTYVVFGNLLSFG